MSDVLSIRLALAEFFRLPIIAEVIVIISIAGTGTFFLVHPGPGLLCRPNPSLVFRILWSGTKRWNCAFVVATGRLFSTVKYGSAAQQRSRDADEIQRHVRRNG